MQNEFFQNYGKLNNDGKFFVDNAIKVAMNNPAYLTETPPKELESIKHRQKEEEEIRRNDKEVRDKYFAKLNAECDGMTAEDYRKNLSEIFASLEHYKLRWFYRFIKAKLEYVDKN